MILDALALKDILLQATARRQPSPNGLQNKADISRRSSTLTICLPVVTVDSTAWTAPKSMPPLPPPPSPLLPDAVKPRESTSRHGSSSRAMVHGRRHLCLRSALNRRKSKLKHPAGLRLAQSKAARRSVDVGQHLHHSSTSTMGSDRTALIPTSALDMTVATTSTMTILELFRTSITRLSNSSRIRTSTPNRLTLVQLVPVPIPTRPSDRETSGFKPILSLAPSTLSPWEHFSFDWHRICSSGKPTLVSAFGYVGTDSSNYYVPFNSSSRSYSLLWRRYI